MSVFALNRRWLGALLGHLAALEMTSAGPNMRYSGGARRLGADLARCCSASNADLAVSREPPVGSPGLALGVLNCHPGAMPELADHQGVPRSLSTARRKLLVSFGAAVAGGAVAGAAGAGRAAPLIGWDILALVFCGWVWSTVWKLDAKTTARHASQEEPSRDLAGLVLLGAAIASLVAVGVVLFGAGGANGNLRYFDAGLALFSVFVSWTLVHTVFTLKYARLYYSGTPGGIDFNEAGAPDYADFAYLSFTIGMTFQVSDTNIGSKRIRRTALRHAWLSFPLDAVIIATSINLVSGLVK
jgi:uncharacterized membrane protein